MIKKFAWFDETGVCQSVITVTDPSMVIPDTYEEITDPYEKKLCRPKMAKKVIDDEGHRWIVPVE